MLRKEDRGGDRRLTVARGMIGWPTASQDTSDPRRFSFAIVCMRCGEKRNTLQGMRIHLRECPKNKRHDLVCGHCEYRTSSWPAMCTHINRSGMHLEAPCRPEFRMDTAPPRLFPSPLPPVSPSASQDASTSGARYHTYESLSSGQLASFQGEAVRLRRGHHSTPHAPSSSQAAPCTEPDIVSCSMQEANLSAISVSSPPGEPGDVGPDDYVKPELPLPHGHLHSPSPDPQDFSGVAPIEVPGPEWLADVEVDEMVESRVLQVPVGFDTQNIRVGWPTPERRQSVEAQGAVEALLEAEPAVLLVAPLENASSPLPPVDASEPAEETPVFVSVEPPRVCAADSATEDAPPSAQPLPSRPARERRPPSPSTEYLMREIQQLRRLNLSCRRQLKFWADTIKTLDGEYSRQPTAEEQSARRQLISQGDWPALEGIETATFAELARIFSDIYGALLHDHQRFPAVI